MIKKIFEKIPKIDLREYFEFNRILKILILSDISMVSGWGLVSPIFAVFVTEQINGGSLVVVGTAEAILLTTKSLLQIPVGAIVDNTKGEKIDLALAFAGSVITALGLLSYAFASLPFHIYLIEFILGLASALIYPAWMGLFTRNMDEGKESFLWSLYSTPTELASAGTAALGGYLAEYFHFPSVFLLASLLCLIGAIVLLPLYPYIAKD